MALSNWDTMAFNEQGKSSRGIFVHPQSKVELELYKNWLYIRSAEMWKEAKWNFTNNTIAHLNEGNVRIGGWEIDAIRGPQSSIFFLASYGSMENGKYTKKFVGGISGSGYRDVVEDTLISLGRANEINEDWCEFSEWNGDDDIRGIHNFATNEKIITHRESQDGPYDYSADWIGILQATFEAYVDWIRGKCGKYDNDIADWLAKVEASEKLRYNQGDAYFADAGLLENMPATEAEKTHKPVFNTLLDNIFPKEDDNEKSDS